MSQGARIDNVRSKNSARAGQVNNSNLTENISLVANSNIPVGLMVAINSTGKAHLPTSDGEVATVVGASIEDFNAGKYYGNEHNDNTGKKVGINVFGGAWVIAETAVGVGKSPYIRHTKGADGTIVGAVRNDADTDKASQNEEFTVRRMSADGKSALVIQKSMLI